ncbi:MAG: M28 family peptidase [Flavobacteriales bacterium]|nr:M28 family peptidase [Flavobacteriales bacterium]
MAFSLGNGQDISYVKEQAEILSSARMKGRGYVDRGLDRAAQHIAAEFKNLGLKPYGKHYFQEFDHKVNTFPGKMELTIDSQEMQPGADFIVDPASPLFAGRLRAQVYDGNNLQTLPSLEVLQEECENCLIVLDMQDVEEKEVLKEARQLKYLLSDFAPVIWLKDEKRTWGVSNQQLEYPIIECASNLLVDGSLVEIKIEAVFESSFTSKNVIGYIPGSKYPDSLIAFTAHYDHLGMMGDDACFFGANDNASGTAYILSLAKHYMDYPPECTLAFIAFAGEEAGLVGSRYFVENPLFPLENLKFVINLDLMGSGVEGITVVNARSQTREFDLLETLNRTHDLLPQIKARGQAPNSDHYYFSEAGVPAIFIYALGGSTAYHDIYDVSSNLTFEEYNDIFKLLTLFVNKL